MKRTPLRRSPMRRGKKRSKYATRERDLVFMGFVKTLPCAVKTYAKPWEIREETPCRFGIEADHMGKRPMGHKAEDDTTVPMCAQHHVERTIHTGIFKYATKAVLREWMDAIIARTKAMYAERSGVELF